MSTNRTNTKAHDGQIIVGITKNLQNVTTPLLLGGQSFTPASLIAFFQNRIDLANQVVTAKAQWIDLGKQYEALNATANLVERGLKQYVMNANGEASPVLADYGFTPPKHVTLSVEQQQQAIAKRKATRKARNTLGKKQKAGIHGTVPATAPVASGTKAPPATPSVPTGTGPAASAGTAPPAPAVAPAPAASGH